MPELQAGIVAARLRKTLLKPRCAEQERNWNLFLLHRLLESIRAATRVH
jgi:hypothetical protein